MSLEKQLEELNTTLARGCDLLEQLIALGNDKPVVTGDTGKPAAKPKAAEPAAKLAKEEPATTEEEPAAAEKTTADVPDYETEVKPLVLNNAKDHKETIVTILSRFGCKTAKKLQPEQYREFMDRLQNAIDNGIEADVAEE